MKLYIMIFSFIALAATAYQTACSKVDFATTDASSLQSASGGPGSGDATGNLNQTGVTITNGTVTGVTVTGGTVGANGTVTGGTITGGTVTGGTIVGGPNNGGTITGGTITGGTITGGTITGGTVGPGGTVTGGTLTGGTITGVTVTGGTVTTPPPTNLNGADVPGVRFVGPPCHINTSCQAQFVLDKALAYPFSFHWRTNDSAYLNAPPSPGVIYGKPNLHYIPTSGDLVFQAGETSKSVYIQNINPDASVAIVIQVVMSQCYYSSTTYACTAVFH